MTKSTEYAVKLNSAISEMFDDLNENHISMDEISESDNATAFIHALATVMPNYIYNKLTGSDIGNLEFNHVANRLCFQFCDKA